LTCQLRSNLSKQVKAEPGVCPNADEQLDAAYSEVKSVISIGRGIGYWGDMVVELRNGDKIEMRALPRCALLVHRATELGT
jgi:hypothetical protein